ncbi:hypothetical protein KSP40_PGU002629 [Platanthera guangdongensis]|uniref:Uncharacterized protein n=1 Tax=Platanthera guangdongensis TaxID=2320717 RepID=A0ABR2MZ58_9ASPA
MEMLFLVYFFPLILTSEALFFSFNSSALPVFPAPPTQSAPSSKSFLKEILNAIEAKEQWDPDVDARVSVVETESARVSAIQSFEFHVRSGWRTLILKFVEEAEAWRKAGKGEVQFGTDSVSLDEGFRPGIRVLKLEGPLELHAIGDNEFSLHLPSVNITHQALKRVLVGEGISIEIDGDGEISIFYPYDISFLSSSKHKQSRDQFWPLGLFSCAPMVLVRVACSASLVAFRIPDAGAYVKSTFLSRNTIELLPEKCYSNGLYERTRFSASPTLASKFAVMDQFLSSFLGRTVSLGRSSRLLRTKITSSSLLKFHVEVERNITDNDKYWKNVAEWRTRPNAERSWFEIIGRFEEGGRGLRPFTIRKLSRPLMMVESAAWSHLMSNISFTEFPSFVVPPEALTLDVKW